MADAVCERLGDAQLTSIEARLKEAARRMKRGDHNPVTVIIRAR